MIKIGLALGGGGAKGSYQLGVLRALMENHLLYEKVEVTAGTSIGAINALMVTGKLTYESMVDVWFGMSNKDVYGQKIRLREKRKLFDLDVLYEKLKETLPKQNIDNSTIKGYATLSKVPGYEFGKQIDIRDMKKTVHTFNQSKDPYKIAIASASIPLLFGATQIDQAYYVDGGLVDNFSVQPLIDAGCNLIFVVPLKRNKFDPTPYLDQATIINLEPLHALGASYLSSINFNKEQMDKRQCYGYNLTKYMINYLKEIELIDSNNEVILKEKHEVFELKSLDCDIKESFEISLRDEFIKW